LSYEPAGSSVVTLSVVPMMMGPDAAPSVDRPWTSAGAAGQEQRGDGERARCQSGGRGGARRTEVQCHM
jgi:hypothetical protein